MDGVRHVVEMTPAWDRDVPERGVVCQGPVGVAWLGRVRRFHDEVRCWRGGTLPDEPETVGGPRPQVTDAARARRLLALVVPVPALTSGRDELRTEDMWNSSSSLAWPLARSAHELPQWPELTGVQPPSHGRAPGWSAGLALALALATNQGRRPERSQGPSTLVGRSHRS